MSLRDELISHLIEAKIPSPRLEAGIILEHTAPNYPDYSDDEKKAALDMLSRRVLHEPLDKIIGERAFYKSVFKVSKDVLSPRPDTEILLENALMLLPDDKPYKILDLGLGSGCILLSLLKEREKARGYGVERSSVALKIAQENAHLLEVFDRVNFINQSWNDVSFENEMFDIIVSNPPYIPHNDILNLDVEVKDYDPLEALDGGDDGLSCYREIAILTPKWLKKDGYILLEIGISQAKDVIDIFKQQGFSLVKIVQDLAGIERCVIFRL